MNDLERDESMEMALVYLAMAEARLAAIDALVRSNRGSSSKAKRKFVAAVEAIIREESA